jgi:hypothetical protein
MARPAPEAGRAEPCETVEQVGKRQPFRGLQLGKSIERRKRDRLAVGQDVLDPGNPVGAFAVDQVTHHIERTPGIGSLGAGGEWLRQAPQQRTQNRGSPGKQWECRVELEIHRVRSFREILGDDVVPHGDPA